VQASLLIGLALVVGAPAPKDAKADPSKVEGDWVAESYILGGKESEREKGRVFRFADGKITMVGRREDVEYKLDPKADPPHIDLIPIGKEKADPILGIYKLDGDTLVICFPKGGKADRPAKFESPDGSQIVLLKLKREKKKD
jgi:uncharacterized protein (TIGR03067 family)